MKNNVIRCRFIFVALIGLEFFGRLVANAQPARNNGLPDIISQKIVSVQQDKESWTPQERKMDSHFIRELKQRKGQMPAALTGVPSRVKFEKDGRVLVDIDADVNDALLAQIQAAGGTIIASVPAFRSVRAQLPMSAVETVAALTNVSFVKPAVPARARTGSVLSQGDATHTANLARSNFGVNGAGIKIGVLSDSVLNLAASQASGNLPTNLVVLTGQSGTNISGNSGEGTAMMELIHDLAPGAELYFATAFNSEASFAQNILALQTNGCQIIVDDVAYFDEPPFQDGIVAQSVNTVTANGALYFSSAGNGGRLDAGTAAVWEGDFADGGATTTPITGNPYRETGRLHSFGATNFNVVQGLIASDVFVVTLFWADPWGASTNDYDVFVLNPTGTTVYDYSASSQSGTQNPYEACNVTNGCRILVVKYIANRGPTPADRFIHLQLETNGRGTLSSSTGGNIRGHAAATNAFAVAAVSVYTAYPNAFNSSNPNEYFSSDGPRKVFFHANGAPITPGNFLSAGGATRLKPDISAADGASTSVPGFTSFYGTSAAAPHAAAVAALAWSYQPTLTTAQLRAVLTNTAIDIGASGWDRNSGFGIVMANAAIQLLTMTNTPPSFTVSPLPQAIQCGSNATFSANATGTLPIRYQWVLDGVPVAGANSGFVTFTNVHLPSHTVAITATNDFGAVTNAVTLTVNDTLAPVIALNGAAVLTNELGANFIDLGATANDLCAGSVAIVTNGAVNVNVTGTNTLIYRASDGNGNTNTVTRTIVVRDTTPPTIVSAFTNLLLVADVNCGASMPAVTATNFISATDLSGVLIITQNPTNNAALSLGTNIVVITVADASGNKSFSTNRVIVRDQTPPVIVLNGDGQVTNELGSTFIDPGATAADTCAGIVAFTTNGIVNPSALGTNQLVYRAVDASGNTNQTTRIVVVADTVPPQIQWNFTNLFLPLSSNCVALMLDVTTTNFVLATDIGGVTAIIQSPTNGTELLAGTNMVVVAASDASGNTAFATNQIIVRDVAPPLVMLNGASNITNELGTAFVDPGVVASEDCSGLAFLQTNGAVNVAVAGISILNYLAVDGAGNSNNVSRTVVVIDTTPPAITFTATNLVLAANTDCFGVMPDFTTTNSVIATDLSETVVIFQSPTNGSVLPLGFTELRVTATDLAGNQTTITNLISVTDQTPPQVLTSPQNQALITGDTATLTIVATACSPISYQWFKDAALLVAQTNSSLTISNVTLVDAGSYHAELSSAGGSNMTVAAELQVMDPTTLTLDASANPTGYRDALTISVFINPTNATGAIQFLTNGMAFDAVVVSDGTAITTNVPMLPRGTNWITAIYSGDGSHLAATNNYAQVITNHPPEVLPVNFSVVAGLDLVIPVGGLTNQWSDADGDALFLEAISPSTNGILVSNTFPTLVYSNPNLVDDQFVCTITDGFGGTNFQTVNIWVVPQTNTTPLIASVSTQPSSGVTLLLNGGYGSTYVLEGADDLIAGPWLPIATNTLGITGTWQFTDFGVTNNPVRFYRLKLLP